jgi:hypothetical protein
MLANLIFLIRDPQYTDLWNDILEPDDGPNRGPWVRYVRFQVCVETRMSRDWKQEYYAPLLQVFVKTSFRAPEWMSFVSR